MEEKNIHMAEISFHVPSTVSKNSAVTVFPPRRDEIIDADALQYAKNQVQACMCADVVIA